MVWGARLDQHRKAASAFLANAFFNHRRIGPTMTYPIVNSARQNRILAGIPLSHYARLSEHLKPVTLLAGQVICEPGESLEYVYFPTTCTTSLLSQTTEGDSSELAMTGRDGLVGVSLVLGSHSANHRVVVQCAGMAYRMPASVFQSELARCRELQQLALCHVQALITQMSQSIVCIGHHSVRERLCYWLLFNQGAVGSDHLKVTHETIANMLGVRRESITQALGKLQSAGLVSSGRGQIQVLDREGLTDAVCECFSLVFNETERLYERVTLAPQSTAAMDEGHDRFQEPSLLLNYQDAYDFAPVGFVSLDRNGRVLQTNLSGAIMLGIQRSRRSNSPMTDFIQAADQALFMAFHQEVLSGKCRRHCELTLIPTGHRPDMVVRIDATLDEQGDECRLVMIDVTEEKLKVEKQRDSERQHQGILDRQTLALWFKDHDGRLISANAGLMADWDQFAADALKAQMASPGLPSTYLPPSVLLTPVNPGLRPG
jgi:CRP-like cAMP-binding protein